ncbi:HAD family phosphatase [Actinomadura vinacea]|uniref:HAD family phosphatase n=1 Tax=Actinomadura vinacea TaxID=115336 RepID=A0ABP5WGI0_9ACTN
MKDWIVFDFGAVISHEPPEEAGALLAQALHVEPERFWRAYWNYRRPYDLGHTIASEYWADVCARLSRTFDDALVETLIALDMTAWSHLNDGTLGLIRELAARDVPLALLSNAPAELARQIDQQEWAEPFRHRLFSADLGMAKPDPRIYQELCERLGAAPSDVLFIDDRTDNVEAARRFGIETIHFTDAASLQERLGSRAA